MKKKKLTGKQIKLIINIISLAIFIFSYFYIYERYIEKKEAALLKIESVKGEINDREQMLMEEDSILAQIDEVNAQKQLIIDSFPVYIEHEDNFIFVEQMEKALKVKTSSINTSDSAMFYETILPVRPAEDGNEGVSESETAPDTLAQAENSDTALSTMTATVNKLSMSFVTDYKGFKELADYVGSYPDHTIIESIAVSADSNTGVLTGNMVLKRFALTGSGKKYEAPSIDGIDIGIDNIFGAGNAGRK